MKRLIPVLAAALLVTAIAGPAAAARPGSGGATLQDVTGTVAGTANQFVGDVTVSEVSRQGSTLVATGTIVGTVTNAATGVVTQVNDTFTTTLAVTQAACDILTLTLGPLHLDLLGLVIDLDQVNLDITAEPGPGNLLGNLLCAVAGLLDNSGSPLTGLLNQLATLLNQILSILG